MEHAHGHAGFLLNALFLLFAAVVAVPLSRLLGLSAVLGYIVSGVALGPSLLGIFDNPRTMLGIAELGVVMFLFVIGLELKPSQLISMRRQIAVLGAGQMVVTAGAVAVGLHFAGLSLSLSIVAAVALSLSATAIALQLLEERGDLGTPYGQRAFSVLLFQDMAIVPILAILPLVAGSGGGTMADGVKGAAIAVASLAALILAGRYLLNPFFALLARFRAREVLTAAALLVVLGAAEAMSLAGMSMALGAFLAGLMLAESNFRHQLEADIEPFRGLLLGLFFMSVGMTIDMSVVAANWPMLLGAAVAIVLGKLAVAFAVVRLAGSPKSEALAAAAVLTPAGEFAFVLLPLAVSLAIATPAEATLLSALAALTMLVGPLVAKGIEFWQKRQAKAAVPAEAEDFTHAQGSVLVVGFGRFGQMVNQVLLAADADVTVIDHDIEQIRAASRFGFKVYFGDGTRLDVLRAAGAAKARLIAVCIDNKEQTLKVVDLVQAEFPHALLHVRAYDRVHAIALMERDVDYQIRETSESALSFGGQTLLALGETSARTAELLSEVRKRDVARLMMQKAEGLMSGHHLLTAPKLAPSPLSEPRSRPKALSPETQGLIDHADRVTVE